MYADVVVVGGGSCGCVLAARLSENPDRTVLLLESGPGYRSAAQTPGPLRDVTTLPVGPSSDWTCTYPVRLTTRRPATVTRGRVLGGSGAVNGAYFVRARPEDFDAWPASWSYAQTLPHFRAVESDADFADEWHGDDGPIPVARTPWESLHPISLGFHEAAVAAGHAIVDDLNAPGPDGGDASGGVDGPGGGDVSGPGGVGRVPLNVRDGERTGPAHGYLLPALERSNLTVRTGVSVRRIVLSGSRAVGVEIDDGTGPRTVRAGHVMLAAGAVGSPHLLMLSGIGRGADLLRHGIAPLVELPGVGTCFTDHPEIAVPYRYREPIAIRTPILQVALHVDELEFRPYTAPFGMAVPGSGIADPVLGVVLTRPRSRGALQLDPTDPARPPHLDYRYLEDPADRRALREGVGRAVDLLAALPHLVDTADLEPVEATDAWLEAHLGTSLHLSGSCRMGTDAGAVVDERCRVHGVEGLSVVDTSVFPEVPSRGPHATAVMLAHAVPIADLA